MPAALEYSELARSVDGDLYLTPKDLEVYSADGPPAEYSLHSEIEGLLRAADRIEAEQVHLVDFSAGASRSPHSTRAGSSVWG